VSGAPCAEKGFADLIVKILDGYGLDKDGPLRGLEPPAAGAPIVTGDYGALIEDPESSDRVIGIL
jgi:hypothetical protein